MHDFEGVMTTSQRFIKELQQVNTPYCDRWLNSFYFYIGHTQMSLQHQKEAAESFDEAYRCTIRGFDNDTTGISMPTAMLTFSNIATSYFSFDMTDEAEKWVNREDSVLQLYRQYPHPDSLSLEIYSAFVLWGRAK